MMNLQNTISQVDPPGAHQLAFSAKHALFDLLLNSVCLSTEQQSLKPADVEIGKMSCRTCGSAASAGDATKNSWLGLNQIITEHLIVPVIIDLPVSVDCITELFQFFYSLKSKSLKSKVKKLMIERNRTKRDD